MTEQRIICLRDDRAAASATVPAVLEDGSGEQTEVYLAIRDFNQRSHMVDVLVLDSYDVSAFQSASELWERFQSKPVRFVITDRNFNDGFNGLDLGRNIRRHFLLPYVFIVMLSSMAKPEEIEEGLASGVDDYLIKPPNPRQLRTRVLVGSRWLQFLDKLNSSQAEAPTSRAGVGGFVSPST